MLQLGSLPLGHRPVVGVRAPHMAACPSPWRPQLHRRPGLAWRRKQARGEQRRQFRVRLTHALAAGWHMEAVELAGLNS